MILVFQGSSHHGFLKKVLVAVILLVLFGFSLHALPVEEDIDVLDLQREIPSVTQREKNSSEVQKIQETTMDTNITSSSSAPRKLGLQDFNEIVQIHQADPQKHVVIEGDQDSGYKLVTKISNPSSELSTEITVPTAQEVEENKKVRDAFFALVTRGHNISSEKLARIRGVQEESSDSPLSVGTICQVMKDLTRHKVLWSHFGIPSPKQPFAVFQEPDPFCNNITTGAMRRLLEKKQAAIDQGLKAFREEYPALSQGPSTFSHFLLYGTESDLTSRALKDVLFDSKASLIVHHINTRCAMQGNPEQAAISEAQIKSLVQQAIECKFLKEILDFKIVQDTLPEIKAELDQELEAYRKEYPLLQEILEPKRWFGPCEQLEENQMFRLNAEISEKITDPTKQVVVYGQLVELAKKAIRYRALEIKKTAISQTAPLIESFTEKASAAYREDFGTAKFPHTLERYSKIGEKMVEYSLKYEKALLKEFSQKGSSSYWLNAIKYLAEGNETETLFWVEVAKERDMFSLRMHGYYTSRMRLEAKVQKKLFLDKQREAGKSDPQIAELWSEAVNKVDGAIGCFENPGRGHLSVYIEPLVDSGTILMKSADAVVQKITFLQQQTAAKKQQTAAKESDPHNEDLNLWKWNLVINKTDDAIRFFDTVAKLQIQEETGKIYPNLKSQRAYEIEAAKNLLEEATALAKELSPSSDAVNNKVP